MPTTSSTAGFEYRNKKGETPFETFLRYTDEKEKSSTQLATILQNKVNDARILDIGTGNGEYLGLALDKVTRMGDCNLTLVEPSSDLAKQLKGQFSTILPESNIKIVCYELYNFSSDEKFDIVLASHLFYHIPRPAWSSD